jgi:hypothetical protein
MIIHTYGPNKDQVIDILSVYDMRTGRREIHREMMPGMVEVYTISIDGEREPVTYLCVLDAWRIFTAGMDREGIGTIAIVSRDTRQRVKRQGKRYFIPECRRYDLAEVMDRFPDRGELIASIETIRREKREREWESFQPITDRDAETVSDYLPDFKVYLSDVLPEVMEDKETRQNPPCHRDIPAGSTVHGIAIVSPDGKSARFGKAVPGLAF